MLRGCARLKENVLKYKKDIYLLKKNVCNIKKNICFKRLLITRNTKKCVCLKNNRS